MELIPRPNGEMLFTGVYTTLPSEPTLDLGGFSTACVEAFAARAKLVFTEPTQAEPFLRLTRQSELADEGYSLCISPKGVNVCAKTERGVIWALTTLYALLEPDGRVPCGSIEDAPRFPHRGLHLDCARHFFPLSEVERIVEASALVKLNVLHWHLSDDQGWRIESKRFPLLHETSKQYYTQEQIRALVAFAHARGVEVLPEIDMPGHTIAILAAYPALGCTGARVMLQTHGGIFRTILCAGKEEPFAFIESLLDELCPLFPSPRFHIGGDEAPKSAYSTCPDCQARMKEEGLTDCEALQGYFTARVAKMLEKHGKTPVCWNDALLAHNLPSDVLIQYWSVQHEKRMRAFIQGGGLFVYADMFELYLDYPHSMLPLKRVYNCRMRVGGIDCTKASGMYGLEGCLWTEHIDSTERLETRAFPRAVALAEAAWSIRRDYASFKRRLRAWCARMRQSGLRFTDETWWDPRGRARGREALAYFAGMNDGMGQETYADTMDSMRPSGTFIRRFATEFFNLCDLPRLIRELLRSH